jgi:hypothetical protein
VTAVSPGSIRLKSSNIRPVQHGEQLRTSRLGPGLHRLSPCRPLVASGWFALLDGFAAGYLASAIVLNVTLGKELLPMWPARSRPKRQ